MTTNTMTPADFDASIAAWNANKIRRGASYAYRCQAIQKTTGSQCKKAAITTDPTKPYVLCASHTKYSKPTAFSPWTPTQQSSPDDTNDGRSVNSPS
jgi:hypothetical protein